MSHKKAKPVIKCMSKACKIYHHKGFKLATALILLLIAFTLKGEKISLGAFIVRMIDLAADLITAKGLKIE